MKRDVLFLKDVGLANALLATKKCENTGNWTIRCNDNIEDMKILQDACTEYLAKCPYTSMRNYKLTFANSENYRDFITI